MLRIVCVEIMTLWGKSDTLTNLVINMQEVEIGQMTAEKRFPDVSFIST